MTLALDRRPRGCRPTDLRRLALPGGRLPRRRLGSGGHRLGGGDVRRPVRGRLVDAGRRAARTSPARWLPGTDVLFLDTGYHFAETLGTRDAMAATYPLEIINLTPRQTVAEQDARVRSRGCTTATPTCAAPCARPHRSTEALTGYDAWATGVRRADSPARAGTKVVVVRPEARRGQDRAARRVDRTRRSTPTSQRTTCCVNPLLQQGFPSIGCSPCTRAVLEGEDPRAGRWAGLSKTECGIHT